MISVSNLSKTINERTIIHNVSFDIGSGESLVIIGGSGSGKSVLIKCILGLMIPDPEAKVVLCDTDVSHIHISKRNGLLSKIGVAFQANALFDSMTVWQNIAFALIENMSMNRRVAYSIACEQLEMVGLDKSVADLYPAEISGGMQRRVAIARAVISKPEILFLDEPTAGLDPVTAKLIADCIYDICKKLAITVVTATHDMPYVNKLSDFIAVMHNGNLSWFGKKENSSESQHFLDFKRAAQII